MNRKTEEINPVPKQSLLELAEVSILLDSYDDIFSDFDPSAYSERTLSDDFIIQAKKNFRNKSGNKKISLGFFCLPINEMNRKKK